MTIDLSKLPPRDALHFAIGEYVQEFSKLEAIVAALISRYLGLDMRIVLFILKDVFVSQKIKLLRRAAVEKVGEEKSACIRGILREIENKKLEFRNTLVHGGYIGDGGPDSDLPLLHGKLGISLSDFKKGLKPISYVEVQQETKSLTALILELVDAFRNLEKS